MTGQGSTQECLLSITASRMAAPSSFLRPFTAPSSGWREHPCGGGKLPVPNISDTRSKVVKLKPPGFSGLSIFQIGLEVWSGLVYPFGGSFLCL